MRVSIPRLVIAGLSGDSGKTLVSLSLLAALRRKGTVLSVFKKGPDYIDAAWLTRTAGSTCRNLDTYLVDTEGVCRTFTRYAADSELAVIEGNRGLFDGRDAGGTHSTAELARLLQAPVVLVVNCTKATRTVAAIVNGCRSFDPQLNLAGVILNQIAGERHGCVISDAIERYCRLPVLGLVPRLRDEAALIPGRHLGLVPPAEHNIDASFHERLAAIAAANLDLDRIMLIAAEAPPLEMPDVEPVDTIAPSVRIGYFDDPVFTFYYPENLEALQAHGAELVPINSLTARELPEVDALYIGGGFPETHAAQLAGNRALLEAVRRQAENGLPVYAECGGLIFLSRRLIVGENVYPMAGLFPGDLVLSSRPVGHGYTELHVDQPNPFFATGTTFRGHEFHYTSVRTGSKNTTTCLKVKTGVGLGQGRDGLVYKQVLAAYTHLHAAGVPTWGAALTARAREFASQPPLRQTPTDIDSDCGDLPTEIVTRKGESCSGKQRPASSVCG